MTKHSSPLWVGTVLAVLAHSALATDYYVSTNGNDNQPGTLEAPFATLNKASNEARSGDRVILREGTYYQQLIPAHSGSAGAPITYQAHPGETVHLRGKQRGDAVVYLTNKDWIVLKDLHIRMKGYGDNYATHIANIYIDNANNNLLDNLTIFNEDPDWSKFKRGESRPREYGIVIKNNSADNIIQNSDIHHMPHQGIHLKEGNGVRRTIIRNNDLSDNYGNSVSISTTLGTISGTLIENNLLNGSVTSDGVQSNRNFDIPQDQFDKSACGVIVRNNIIAGNAENGVDPKGACQWVVEGNIIYSTDGNNDGNSDVGVEGLPGADRWVSDCASSAGSLDHSEDFIVRNNIIYDNLCGLLYRGGYRVYNNALLANHRDYMGPNSQFPDAAVPFFQGLKNTWEKSSDNPVVVKNNIIGGNRYQLQFQLNSRQPVHLDHNLYYGRDGNVPLFMEYRDKRDYSALNFEQWKTRLSQASIVSGKEQNSLLSTGPSSIFQSVPWRPVGDHQQYDFALLASSPGSGKGDVLSRTSNSAGNSNTLVVEDAKYFFDGFGVTEGDAIRIGSGPSVRITSVNYATNTLLLSEQRSWTAGDSVVLSTMKAAPDIGPYKDTDSGGNTIPSPPTGLSLNVQP